MNDLATCSFYGILDTRYVPNSSWLAKYQALADGGAGLIQVRTQDRSPEEQHSLVQQIVDHRASLSKLKQGQPHLIVNDSVELCLRFPDLGLHIENAALTAEDARAQLGPDRILGASASTPEHVERLIDLGPSILSYFSVGAVFETQTKPEATVTGLDLVRFVAEQKPSLPFFCIGGINRSNIPQVRSAGGRRIVTVADVLCDADTQAAVARSIELVSA